MLQLTLNFYRNSELPELNYRNSPEFTGIHRNSRIPVCPIKFTVRWEEGGKRVAGVWKRVGRGREEGGKRVEKGQGGVEEG